MSHELERVLPSLEKRFTSSRLGFSDLPRFSWTKLTTPMFRSTLRCYEFQWVSIGTDNGLLKSRSRLSKEC